MSEEQAIEKAREELLTDDVTVRLTDGHSGPGWYAWDDEYPEEGSIFLGEAA